MNTSASRGGDRRLTDRRNFERRLGERRAFAGPRSDAERRAGQERRLGSSAERRHGERRRSAPA